MSELYTKLNNLSPLKKILLGAALSVLVIIVVLVLVRVSTPSLEDRALKASETISASLDEEEQAVTDIEAKQADVQAAIDAANEAADAASAPYMEGNTSEMLELREESEELYDAAEEADDAWFSDDYESEAESARLEDASDAAWNAYDAKEDEISELESSYEDQYNEAQDRLEAKLKPLDKEMSRLTDLSMEAYDGQSFAMMFSVMAECPELVAMGEDIQLDDKTVRNADLSESCVENLERWAGKVS